MEKIKNKVAMNIVRKYSKEPKNKWSDIIAAESKKLFKDLSYKKLIDLYRKTNYKWLIYPEITRRKSGNSKQLALFSIK